MTIKPDSVELSTDRDQVSPSLLDKALPIATIVLLPALLLWARSTQKKLAEMQGYIAHLETRISQIQSYVTPDPVAETPKPERKATHVKEAEA